MELARLLETIDKIKGCTFASIDSVTEPVRGLTWRHEGERVILFNCDHSGYEAMVRRRLEKEGKDPNFTVDTLPWGERVKGPLIHHKGKHYLQTIQLQPGTSVYKIGQTVIPAYEAERMLPRRSSNQGLELDNTVRVNTYNVDNITEIRLMGERL